MPAEDYAPERATILYMFHPFGRGTLQAVLARIERSLAHHPRNLRIVYVNPVHADLIDASPTLQRIGEWTASKAFGRAYPTRFWHASRLASR